MDDKLAAKILIQKCQGTFYGIYVDKLVAEMAQQISYNAGVCYQVFVQLAEMDYSTSDIINVARGLLDKTNSAVLSQLATTPDGGILLRTIYAILKCGNADNQTAARCTKIQQSFAVATGSSEAKPVAKPNDTSDPIKLSDTEIDFYNSYNQTSDVMWNYSKKQWNKSGPRVTFDASVCWKLPTKGTGFTTYNVDDLKGKRNDVYGYDQIGTKETIDAMIKLAGEWNSLHPDKLLQYGDISRPGGINTPDHGTHMNGKAFDMRLLRNDSQLLGLTYNDKAYHRDFTKEFILIAVKLFSGTTVYFNDSVLHKDSETRSYVSPMGGHDDHLHVMFPGGKE